MCNICNLNYKTRSPGIGFNSDDEGNFDIENKKICECSRFWGRNDVTSKICTDNLVIKIKGIVDQTVKHTDDMSSSFKILNKVLTQLQMECNEISINAENKLNKKKIINWIKIWRRWWY